MFVYCINKNKFIKVVYQYSNCVKTDNFYVVYFAKILFNDTNLIFIYCI